MARRVETAACRPQTLRRRARRGRVAAPLVVVTGARGFLGGDVARALDRVRGIGRAPRPDDPPVQEWVAADLSHGVSPDALAGADVVVHAAAETAGDFDGAPAQHYRRHAASAARDARRRCSPARARQQPVGAAAAAHAHGSGRTNERRGPAMPGPFGAYVWGKSLQEELVEREAPALGIATRIIRPGRSIDGDDPRCPD